MAYYLLCRCLAAHAASLPSAVSGRLVASWTAAVGSGASDGDAEAAGFVHCILAALAAACAGGAQGAGSALATVTQTVLPNAQLLRKKGKLFGGASEVSGLPARDDGAGAAVVPSHRSALGAARRAQEMPPPWGSRTAAGSALSSASLLVGLCSADAIAARHAMAVRPCLALVVTRALPDAPRPSQSAVYAAAQSPADAAASLAPLVTAALAVPPLAPRLSASDAAASRPARQSHDAAALKPLRPGLNLEDGECRCHFAVLCSVLAHRRRDGLVTGTGERLFWDALTALLRDTNERVALTSIRGLCCDLTVPSPSLGSSPVDHLLSEAASTHHSRAAAWLTLAGEPRAMCLRLVQAAIRGSPATAATALRAAVALARCRTSALVAGLARGDDGDGARLDSMFASAEARMEGHSAYGAPWGLWTGRIWQHDLNSGTPFLDGITAVRTFMRPEWAHAGAVVPLVRAMAQRCTLQPEAAASLLPACQRLLLALPITTVAHPSLGGSPDGALCALWTAVATFGGASQEPGLRRTLAATLTSLRATSATFTHDDAVASTAVVRAALLFAASHVALPSTLAPDAQAVLHALHRSCVSSAPAVRVCAATALARVALRSPAQARQVASSLLLSCGGGCVGVDDVCGTHAALIRRFAGAAAAFDQAAAASSNPVELQDATADLHRQCVAAAAKALRLPEADTHVCLPLGLGSEPLLAAWSARTGHAVPGTRPVQQKQTAVTQLGHSAASAPPVPGLEGFGSDPFGVAAPPALAAVHVPLEGATAGHAPSDGPLFDDFSPQESPAAEAPVPRRFFMDEFDQLPSFSNAAFGGSTAAVADGSSSWSPGPAVAPPPPSVDVFADPFSPGAASEGMRFVGPSSFAFDDMRRAPAPAPAQAAVDVAPPAWEDPFAAPQVAPADGDSFFTSAPTAPPAATEDPFASPAAPAERVVASDPFADFGAPALPPRAVEAVVDPFGGTDLVAVTPPAPAHEAADPFAAAAPRVAADEDLFGGGPFTAAPPAPAQPSAEAADPFASAAPPPPPQPADSDPFSDAFAVAPPLPLKPAPAPAPAPAFSDPFADFAPAPVAPPLPAQGDPFAADSFAAAAPAPPSSSFTAVSEHEDEESEVASTEASDDELGFDADVSAATKAVEQAIMAKFAANKAAREAAAGSPGFVPPPAPPPRRSPQPQAVAFEQNSDPFSASFAEPPAAVVAAPPPPPAAFADPFAAPSESGADPFSEPPAAPVARVSSPFDDPFAAPPALPPAPAAVPAAVFDDPFAEPPSATQPPEPANLYAPPAVHASVEPASEPEGEEEGGDDESEAASTTASDESDEMGFDANVLAQAEAVQRSIMAKFAANKAARDAASGSPVAAMPPPAQPQHELPEPAVRQLAFDSDPFASGGVPAAAPQPPPQLPPQPTAPAAHGALDVDLFSSLETPAPPAPQPAAAPAAASEGDWFATPPAPSPAASADPFASFGTVEVAPPSTSSDPFGSPQDGPASGSAPVSDPFAPSAAPAALVDPFMVQPSPPPAPPVVVAPPPSVAVPVAPAPAAAPGTATPPAPGKATGIAARAAMFAPQQTTSAPALRAKSPPPVVVPEPASSAASAVDSPAVQTEIKSFADRRRAFEAAAQAAAMTGAAQAVVRVQPSKRFGAGASVAAQAQAAPAARDSFVFGGDAPSPAPLVRAEPPAPAPQAKAAEPPKAAQAAGASRRASLLAEMAAASAAHHEEASDDESSHFPQPGSSLHAAPSPPVSAPGSPMGLVVTFRKGLVLYDFTAEASNELSVKTGDVVMVRFDDGVKLVSDGWVSCQDQSQELGLVPDAYIAVKD